VSEILYTSNILTIRMLQNLDYLKIKVCIYSKYKNWSVPDVCDLLQVFWKTR